MKNRNRLPRSHASESVERGQTHFRRTRIRILHESRNSLRNILLGQRIKETRTHRVFGPVCRGDQRFEGSRTGNPLEREARGLSHVFVRIIKQLGDGTRAAVTRDVTQKVHGLTLDIARLIAKELYEFGANGAALFDTTGPSSVVDNQLDRRECRNAHVDIVVGHEARESSDGGGTDLRRRESRLKSHFVVAGCQSGNERFHRSRVFIGPANSPGESHGNNHGTEAEKRKPRQDRLGIQGQIQGHHQILQGARVGFASSRFASSSPMTRSVMGSQFSFRPSR